MAVKVLMPKLTHDMEAGVLLELYKKEGDKVQRGAPLFAVETDKATVDVEAEATGVLRGLRFQPGDKVSIGEVIGWIAAPGEEIPPLEGPGYSPPARADHGPSESPERERSRIQVDDLVSDPRAGGRIVASPVAKRIAKTHGIDLRQIKGRGPHGRVTKADVQAHMARSQQAQWATAPLTPTAPSPEAPYDVVPLSKLRLTTGERMLSSVRTAPHFDMEIDVDMSEAARWRTRYAEGDREKVSYTALLVVVVAHALGEHRQLNAAFVDGELRIYREINVGIATATDRGLMVPVIHHADTLSLSQVQGRITQLREKAQESRFAPDEVRNGTFTLSNLGMYGIDAFRAIINPPEAAILAVGRIVERPVGVDGQVVLRPIVRLVLSVDHRAVDGAQAASFLAAVRRYLENPYLLL